MCTGLSFVNGNNHYFGRNLDLQIDFPITVTTAPRNYAFNFRHEKALTRHNAMIGMGMVEEGYPLFFEGINEKGLGMAGLAFATSCHYFPVQEGKTNIASFEFIPYILGQAGTVQEARKLLENLNITDDAFNAQTSPSPLHWIIGDEKESIVVESTEKGLNVYDDAYGVLTNEPEFPFQTLNLNFYCNIRNNIDSGHEFAKEMPSFQKLSAGMGSAGLPGGVDSISRFVRVAFAKMNTPINTKALPDTEPSNVQQFFHILGTVKQSLGEDETSPNVYEVTQYTCCGNTKTGKFYYTTYFNQCVNCVDMNKQDLEATEIITMPVIRDFQINYQN